MRIFVGCSSSEDVDLIYLKSAKKLGKMIAENGHSLIFGSSDKGMMGELYRGVKENGGKVISVFPKQYSGFLTKVESDEIIETETATDQLKYLVNNGDVTIIMPGSYGALAELSTSIQNKKLWEHNKPIFIININGYFNDILKAFEKFYNDRFDLCDRNKLYTVVNEPDEILNYLNNN
ncbi:MAG: TIGR00730 family Rossman fold protein [Bacilli bacterium]|nr:TIGR00730 family Rossman fold protein [Bacilli bacterium]